MEKLQLDIEALSPLDEIAMKRAVERQNQLTKPPGALGALEEISIKVAGITGDERTRIGRKVIVVMAADHGVTVEGVSAYPSEVTAQMLLNFASGGAAINVLARHVGAEVIVVDIGAAANVDAHGVVNRKVRMGSGNIAVELAMSRSEAFKVVETGVDVVLAEIERGANLIATGDMGIGNTTPSAAVLSAIAGIEPREAVGRGTGINDSGLERKISAIERALTLHAPDPSDGIDILSKVGGLEIGGLAGVILGAASRRVPVVIDGFISGAAALIAATLEPRSVDYMIASHVSVEPGHRKMLDILGLKPMLHMDMRLGEGTGAALGMGLVEAAMKIVDEMATFAEAGVAESVDG